MSSKKDKSHYTKHLNVALHPVETKTRVPPTNQKAVNKVVPLQRINNVVPLQRINKVVPLQRINKVVPLQRINKVVPLQRINKVVPLQRINKVVPVSRRQTFSLKPFSVKKCNCGGGFF